MLGIQWCQLMLLYILLYQSAYKRPAVHPRSLSSFVRHVVTRKRPQHLFPVVDIDFYTHLGAGNSFCTSGRWLRLRVASRSAGDPLPAWWPTLPAATDLPYALNQYNVHFQAMFTVATLPVVCTDPPPPDFWHVNALSCLASLYKRRINLWPTFFC